MIIKRDDRILGARYLSQEGDTGTRWWSAMRGRKRLSVFNGSAVTGEVALGGRPGQLVFASGAATLTPGTNQYPQDAAAICNPSYPTYAGRYLARWKDNPGAAAVEGYDPVILAPTSTLAYQSTLGGKLCVMYDSAYGSNSIRYNPSAPVYSNSITASFFAYRIGSGQQVGGAQGYTTSLYCDLTETRWSACGVVATYAGAYPQNTWVHYAGTFDASGACKLYVNGTLVASATGSPTCENLNQALIQMGWNTAGWRNWRIYTKALSAAEIAAIAAEDAA